MFSLNREILVLHPDLENSLFGGFHYTQNLLTTKDDKLVRWICLFFTLLKNKSYSGFFSHYLFLHFTRFNKTVLSIGFWYISMICVEMLFIDEIYQGQVLEGLESSCMKVLNALYQTEGKFIFISSNSAVRDTVTRPNIYQKLSIQGKDCNIITFRVVY